MVCPHVLLVWRHDSPPSCDEMGGRGGLCRNGGVSSRCSYLCCQISPARLKVQHCKKKRKQEKKRFMTGNSKKTALWSLQWRSPPSDRVFTDWRSRKRRGTSRRDTRRCGRSAPELTVQFGELTRGGGTRLQADWRGKGRRVCHFVVSWAV